MHSVYSACGALEAAASPTVMFGARLCGGRVRKAVAAVLGGTAIGLVVADPLGPVALCQRKTFAQRIVDINTRLEEIEIAAEKRKGGRLISVGEALIDFIPGDDGRFQPLCGGAPFNVALTMARLEAPSVFLSNVSSDMFGDKICAELANDGVDLSLVQRVSDPSTLAFVKLEKGADPQYAFFFNQAADRSLTADTLPSLPADTSALHLSLGAITLEVEPVSSAFYRLFSEKRASIFSSFDPNIRGKMIPDGAAYRQLLLHRWVPLFDLIKVSDADLAFLYGQHEEALDIDAIADEWLSASNGGLSLLLVTRGAKGTVAYRPNRSGKVVEVALGPVEVQDTVGAGDSFQGAFLVSLRSKGKLEKGELAKMSDADVEDSLRFAARVAAVTCTRAGCDPPTLAEMH